MFWFKKRRREKIRNQPFPPEWRAIIERNVRYYALLPKEDQEELRRNVQVFLAEKNFEGCGELILTDEMKVTIAGHACVLLLHLDHDYYPRLDSVLVYPHAFYAQTTKRGPGSFVVKSEEVRAGEAWQRGAVILAWDNVQRSIRGDRPGFNVVYHEFAHLLDMENGDSDGVPAIEDHALLTEWLRVFQDEYDQLVDDLEHGRTTLLDEYAATSASEFFAVTTEAFFETPIDLRRRHPELYDAMRRYFGQDPAELRKKVLGGNEYI